MRLIAAVTNYNGAKNLPRVIKRLLEEDFDAIYILDDASTDKSLWILESFVDDITIVSGRKNLGPAGNRNRILKFLDDDDIVFFVDVDIELREKPVVPVLKNNFSPYDNTAIIGGEILTKAGQPMTFNYGYFMNKTRDFIGWALERLALWLPFQFVRKAIRPLASRFTYNVEIRFFEPKTRSVDWVSEAVFAIRGDVFKKLDGFDDELRYHEGMELAWRAHQAGYSALFTPDILARHLEFTTRENRKQDIREARKLYYKKTSNIQSRQ